MRVEVSHSGLDTISSYWSYYDQTVADVLGVRSKDLKRLFPTDQSMVVVIDDRGDVWGEIPNLVKVIPCESFFGFHP